jgi:hypothetical protein
MRNSSNSGLDLGVQLLLLLLIGVGSALGKTLAHSFLPEIPPIILAGLTLVVVVTAVYVGVRVCLLQTVRAVVKLTWKAAFRYRLFVAVAALLVGSVVLLPLLIKDDGTARGFAQILLTYTLSTITLLLGFATLWLSCGVLARDIEDCQMQMVVVKPIPRWQIWLGKWIGVISLNAALLTVAGTAVYGVLIYRAGLLPEKERQTLYSEILIARGSMKEEVFDVKAAVERYLADRVRSVGTAATGAAGPGLDGGGAAQQHPRVEHPGESVQPGTQSSNLPSAVSLLWCGHEFHAGARR